MKVERFSPKEFLRARRPEKFSDSVVEEQLTLDRSMLEYHLESITSRSQEVKFALFARHLAEREICPNLLPQTGPTGGGDSKVDAETYPVADDLALGWYAGIGREAASERWGFAFSAKKDWQSKVRSDVEKIAKTGRGYSKAFFVSNQFIADKSRSVAEDELRTNQGLDVRILDRNWILDRVFSKGHEAIAIEDLELSTSVRKQVRKGPLDMQRESDLKEIEDRISQALREQRFGLQLAEDCIDAACLATKLERPRTEIDGLFDRAERITTKCGTAHQRLNCAYQRAWTLYWWHEDYHEFSKAYQTVEDRAKGSHNAYHLELLSNVWDLLHTSIVGGRLNEGATAYEERTETLAAELNRLSRETGQPSTALQGKTLLLLMELSQSLSAGERMEPILRELRVVVSRCEGLAGYPFEPLTGIVAEVGKALNGIPAYGELFGSIVKITSARSGEVSAARMLLERGAQQLEADRPADAIRTLGSALRRLYKHESRHDAVRTLYLCGCAYDHVGLLWAARGTLLVAASMATGELWTYGEVTRVQAACYRQLKWLELQLGRLPQVLAWHQADGVARRVLSEKGGDQSQLWHGEQEFDLALGILMLKADFWELKWLSGLPDVLESLGLPAASVALLYALGHEQKLTEADHNELLGDEDLHTTALKWRDQPASGDLPEKPLLYEERKVSLHSRLLGCEITIESESASPCIELAESLLAALESLLATGAIARMVSREPVLTVSIRKSDFCSSPFEFELQESSGRPHLCITCSIFNPHSLQKTEQAAIKKRIAELLCTIFARIVMTDHPVQAFEKLVREEMALERSVDFTGSFVTIGNVLGYNPKNQISSWSEPGARQYPLKRTEPWDADDRRAEKPGEPKTLRRKLRPGKGEPPAELLDRSRTKHTEIKTVSLIRESLWDKAGWIATVFATSPDDSEVPILAPVFSDSDAARNIFSHWRIELGIRDEQERLRLAIVRGISRARPYSYRISIGSNPDETFSREKIRYVTYVNRINTMDAESDENLERFLRNYRKSSQYFFAPATTTAEKLEPKIIWDHRLIKRELHVRDAWQIGRNDPDWVAVQQDDLPIIPAGQTAPPALEVLRWKRERSPARPSLVTAPKLNIGRNDPCPCGSGKKYKKCHGS